VSAWMVSKAHIDVLVQGLAESETVTDVDPDELGRILWRECLASVAYRYPNDGDGERPGPVDFRDNDVETYTYRRPAKKVGLGGLMTAIECYDYQSCEHPGWTTSQARAWVLDLHARLKDAGSTSNGQWGYDEEDVHAA
jgi:hypothetical protein